MIGHALRGRTRYPGVIDSKILDYYLFKDSFEDGIIKWDSYVASEYASLASSTMQSYDKVKSIYIQNTEVSTRYAAIRTNQLFDLTINSGSIYVFPVPDEHNSPQNGFNRQIIWYTNTPNIGVNNVQVGILYDAYRKLGLVVGATVKDFHDYALPLSNWTNIKWYFKINSTNGEAKVWLNDSLILEFTGNTDPMGLNKLGYLWIGCNSGGELSGYGYRRLYMDLLTIS